MLTVPKYNSLSPTLSQPFGAFFFTNMQATFLEIETTCLIIRDSFSPLSSQGAILHFLYNTGCRIEEAIQLERITVDGANFIVDTEKNSENRTFPIDLLPKYYFGLVPVALGDFARKTLGSYTNIVRAIYKHTDKIYYKGRKDILTNIYRYRYAYWLREQGYTNEQIQVAFGHLSLNSTLSYLSPIAWRS